MPKVLSFNRSRSITQYHSVPLKLEELHGISEIDLIPMSAIVQGSDGLLHFHCAGPGRGVDVGHIQRREEWVVSTEHDAIGADKVDQGLQNGRIISNRIVVESFHIFRRSVLQLVRNCCFIQAE